MAKELEYKVIGKIVSIDFEALREFAKKTRKEVHDILYKNKETMPVELYRLDTRFTNFCSWDAGNKPYPDFAKEVDLFEQSYLRLKEFGKEIDVIYEDDSACFVKVGIRFEIFPISCVTIRKVVDYDALSLHEARLLLGVGERSEDSAIGRVGEGF